MDRRGSRSRTTRSPGAVRLNVAGREPNGFIEPGADFDAACEELAGLLAELVNIDTGEPLVLGVARGDALHEFGEGDPFPDLSSSGTAPRRSSGSGRPASGRSRCPGPTGAPGTTPRTGCWSPSARGSSPAAWRAGGGRGPGADHLRRARRGARRRRRPSDRGARRATPGALGPAVAWVGADLRSRNRAAPVTISRSGSRRRWARRRSGGSGSWLDLDPRSTGGSDDVGRVAGDRLRASSSSRRRTADWADRLGRPRPDRRASRRRPTPSTSTPRWPPSRTR